MTTGNYSNAPPTWEPLTLDAIRAVAAKLEENRAALADIERQFFARVAATAREHGETWDAGAARLRVQVPEEWRGDFDRMVEASGRRVWRDAARAE